MSHKKPLICLDYLRNWCYKGGKVRSDIKFLQYFFECFPKLGIYAEICSSISIKTSLIDLVIEWSKIRHISNPKLKTDFFDLLDY